MKETWTLAEAILAGVDSRLLDVHTMLIGRVEKVHASARRVDVRPVYQRVLRTVDDEPVTELLPVIQYVPIGTLRAGSARIELPIQPGHWVCALFFEDNVGKWLAAGGMDLHLDDFERHGLTGAVAMPWLYPDTEKLSDAYDAQNIVIGFDGGAKFTIRGDGEVHLAGGTDYVALAGKVLTELEAIKTAFDSHTHPVATAGSATAQVGHTGTVTDTAAAPPPPNVPGSGAMPAPNSVAASKTKAE